MSDLAQQHCSAVTPEQGALSQQQVSHYLAETAGWQQADDGTIQKKFIFSNYYETLAFVNAVAWIAHQQDHHPELVVNYNNCTIRYLTHSVNGLTLNDFICASRINQLLS